MLHSRHQKQNNIMSYMIKNFLSSLTSFFVSYHVIFDFCRVNIIRHPKHLFFSFPNLSCISNFAYLYFGTTFIVLKNIKRISNSYSLLQFGSSTNLDTFELPECINVSKKSVKHIFILNHLHYSLQCIATYLRKIL